KFVGPHGDGADQVKEGVIDPDEVNVSAIILIGQSKVGLHALDGAEKYGFPAITFNAPGLKPHPFHKVNPVQLAKTTVTPYMSIFRDPFNAAGMYDNRVINYVNQDDVVGNYGVHFGNVVVVDDGGVQTERNDYLHPDRKSVV